MIKFTPENITELKENEIFVFGSNLAGKNGAGAALLASKKFGAEYGVGEGLTGNCYAFPTKDKNIKTLPLSEIEKVINRFYLCVAANPDYKFLLTKVGCGLANYSPKEIAPLFAQFKYIPPNIIFPKEFYEIIYAHK